MCPRLHWGDSNKQSRQKFPGRVNSREFSEGDRQNISKGHKRAHWVVLSAKRKRRTRQSRRRGHSAGKGKELVAAFQAGQGCRVGEGEVQGKASSGELGGWGAWRAGGNQQSHELDLALTLREAGSTWRVLGRECRIQPSRSRITGCRGARQALSGQGRGTGC